MTPLHPLLDRLLKRVGLHPEAPPTVEAWQALLELVARTYREADQDRYTIERAMDISSQEMQALYQERQLHAERELALVRQSDARHRLLFEANPLPMWVIDRSTLQILDVNPAMVATYGYTRDELLRMTATDIKMAEDLPQMQASVRDTPSDAVHHVGIRRHRRKDGGILEMDITAHMLVIDGRECLLGIAHDMTRARRVDEQLRQAQKMEAVGRLAGGIAHDFNNILAVILSNAELVLEQLGEAHKAGKDLVEIRAAAERAAGLTRQLLTFSRKQPRQPRAVALNSIVTRIEAMLTRIVGEDVAMSALISPDLGAIEADPGEIEQVIMNLVVNARDAMPGGGQLRLETANTIVDETQSEVLGIAPGRYVTLAVTDTGCGMSEDVRRRIFEPYFTTKDIDKGTGLGLATVFGIIEQARGGIAVQSEVGRGSTFRLYWPRSEAVVETSQPMARVPVHGVGTVLLVEDDAQLRRVVGRFLLKWGYTLLEAANGRAALAILRQHAGPIDLLLTDLVMPGGIDGRLLSRLVLLERPETRVVFMSGYTEHATLANAKLGPDDVFVQKPFSVNTLAQALEQAFAAPPPARPLPAPSTLVSLASP